MHVALDTKFEADWRAYAVRRKNFLSHWKSEVRWDAEVLNQISSG
jgi:hypothetical protein